MSSSCLSFIKSNRVNRPLNTLTSNPLSSSSTSVSKQSSMVLLGSSNLIPQVWPTTVVNVTMLPMANPSRALSFTPSNNGRKCGFCGSIRKASIDSMVCQSDGFRTNGKSSEPTTHIASFSLTFDDCSTVPSGDRFVCHQFVILKKKKSE
ncbi:hypothetical protein Hanom_Chr06g00487461 [Helianthus anomalus]